MAPTSRNSDGKRLGKTNVIAQLQMPHWLRGSHVQQCILTIVESRFENQEYKRFWPLFCESLSISQVDTQTDGSWRSMSDGVDLPTFYSLCEHRVLFFRSCPSLSDRIFVLPLNTVECFYKSFTTRLCESDRCMSDSTQFRCIGHAWRPALRIWLLTTLNAKCWRGKYHI